MTFFYQVYARITVNNCTMQLNFQINPPAIKCFILMPNTHPNLEPEFTLTLSLLTSTFSILLWLTPTILLVNVESAKCIIFVLTAKQKWYVVEKRTTSRCCRGSFSRWPPWLWNGQGCWRIWEF